MNPLTQISTIKARNGKWRVNGYDSIRKLVEPLWDCSTHSHALLAMNAFEQMERVVDGLRQRVKETAGTTVTKGDFVFKVSDEGCIRVERNGLPVGGAKFQPTRSQKCIEIGAHQGAMTCTVIIVPPHCQRQGMATRIHDFASELYGVPTVPSRGPSEMAQEFWRARKDRVYVPGLSRSSFDNTIIRSARMARQQYFFALEREFKTGEELYPVLKFALSVNELTGFPVISARTERKLDPLTFWVQCPDGSKITAEGFWKSEEVVKSLRGHEYVQTQRMSSEMIDQVLKKTRRNFFRKFGDNQERIELDSAFWAERILVQNGYSLGNRIAEPDWNQEEKERFYKETPRLAYNIFEEKDERLLKM